MLSSNVFDCIVCTYVLHLVFEKEKIVTELYRTLKPGGVLLVAVPDITVCYPQYHELWRFTAEGLHELLARVFGAGNVSVRTYGNSLTAAGMLRGLGSRDFTQAELDYHDPRYILVVCARAVKLVYICMTMIQEMYPADFSVSWFQQVWVLIS
jgi:SAM-dependent methyltransferase